MVNVHTLFRSLLIAAPAACMIACGGASEEAAGSAPEQSGATAATGEVPAAAGENSPSDEVKLNADGVPVSELANDTQVDGTEASDPGYAETVVTSADATPAPSDDASDAVGTTSEALLSTRGTALKSEALRIAQSVKQSTSYYSHTTYMNESTGTRRTDCSGLTGYMLNRVLPDAYTKVPKPSWRAKPLAEDYYTYIAGRYTTASQQSTARWRRITSVNDLKPGDMIVWKYAAPNPNTGHIMIVREAPRQGRTDRGEWIVPVVDSTSTPHAYKSWDSRGSTYTGVGQGSIGLKVDSSGAPRAYYWTGGTSPTAVYTGIVMARIE